MKTVIINRYDSDNEERITENLILGCGSEIKAVYNSIMRAVDKGDVTNIRSLWADRAKFHPDRMYALEIDEDDYINVLTAEVITRMMLDGGDWYVI